jgi:hypothetical protein
MSRWTIVAFMALVLAAAPASAQTIGIFMDPEATSCAGDVGTTPFRDLYVVAILEGSVPVMTGAQFQITGIPESWTPNTALWVPDVGVGINLGHPLFANPIHEDTPGVNLAFAACQGNSGEVTRVPLGRIVLLGAPTPQNVHLRVVGFDLVPTDPDCPFVTNCDAPAGYPKFCVGGGEIVLNGPGTGGCAVAVSEATWSHIKELYR